MKIGAKLKPGLWFTLTSVLELMTRTRPFMVSWHTALKHAPFSSKSHIQHGFVCFHKRFNGNQFLQLFTCKHALKHAIDVCVSLKRVMITASTSNKRNASFYINHFCKTLNHTAALAPFLCRHTSTYYTQYVLHHSTRTHTHTYIWIAVISLGNASFVYTRAVYLSGAVIPIGHCTAVSNNNQKNELQQAYICIATAFVSISSSLYIPLETEDGDASFLSRNIKI